MLEQWIKVVTDWLAVYGLKVVGAIALFVIGRIVIALLVKATKRLLHKAGTDETLGRFLVSLTRGLLMAVLVIATISALGVETTSFIAGLAIGLALQGSLGNFASGVMIIVFRPFKKGDYIEAGGSTGVVEEVAIFNTVLRTPDNKKVIVPKNESKSMASTGPFLNPRISPIVIPRAKQPRVINRTMAPIMSNL